MKIENVTVSDGVISVKLVNVYDLDQRIELQLTTDFEVTMLQNDSLCYGNDLIDEIAMAKSHVKEFVSAYE